MTGFAGRTRDRHLALQEEDEGGGTTRAASTAMSSAAIQVVCRVEERSRGGSLVEIIEDALPFRRARFDRLGREEAHPEVPLLRQARARAPALADRRSDNVRHRAERLLAFREMMKSTRSLAASGCGAFLWIEITDSVPVAGSILIQSTGAPFLALITA